MSYTPLNVDVFTAAFSGAFAGITSNTNAKASISSVENLTPVAVSAGAYAQAVDLEWYANGMGTSTELDIGAIDSASESYFKGRVLGRAAPSQYTTLAKALIRCIQAARNYYMSESITPPPSGGEGGLPGYYNVKTYGAVGNGIADDIDAFEAAIAAMNVAPGIDPFIPEAWVGAVLYLPPGIYRLSRTLQIPRQMIVQGTGGAGDYASSVIVVAKGQSGIDFEGVYLSPTGGRADYAQMRDVAVYHEAHAAFASTLRPLKWEPLTIVTVGEVRVPSVVTAAGYALRCTAEGTTDTIEPAYPVGTSLAGAFVPEGTAYLDGTATWEVFYAHGIKVRSPYVRLENCQIVGFPSNGIDVLASYSTIPPTYGSLSFFGKVRSEYNGGHGLFLAGDDTNAGVAINCDFSNNQGFGVNNRAFLNFTFLALHTEGNEGGAPYYSTSGDWVGCYAEGNQGAIVLHNGTWTGGVAGAGLFDEFSDRYRTPWTALDVIPAAGVRRPTADNDWYYISYAGGTTGAVEPTWPVGRGKTVTDGTVEWLCYGLTETTTTPILAINGRNLRALSVRTPDQIVSKMGSDGAAAFAFQFSRLNQSTGVEEHGYALNYDGAHDWGFYGINSAQTAAFLTTEATANWPQYGAGYFSFPRGFIIGGGGAYQRLLGGLEAPIAGAWIAGDTMFNATPAIGAAIGWRCVTSGSPGTWEPLYSADGATITPVAFDIDWSTSHAFQKTLAAGANAFTFSNVHDGQKIDIAVTGAISTLTWPVTVKWPGGIAPIQTASGTDVYTLSAIGGSIYGSVKQDYS